jgi:hypothetical protein
MVKTYLENWEPLKNYILIYNANESDARYSIKNDSSYLFETYHPFAATICPLSLMWTRATWLV